MEGSRRIFTEVIKRQMAILGPDITIAKVKNVPGIEMDSSGEVTAIHGDPKVLLSELINQFVELSGLIVKKTMESIIMSHPDSMSILEGGLAGSAGISVQQTQPQQPSSQTSGTAAATQEGPPNVPAQNAQNPTARPAGEQDDSILSANKDIDELNKMLENLNKGNSK